MKLFNRVILKEADLKKALTQTVASLSVQLQRIGWQGAAYTTYDPETSFKDAFEKNAIYFSVIDRISEKFGHIPRYVYKPETKEGKKYRKKALDENIADGELMQLLLKPNTYQGQDQFFYLVAASYKSCGETFIWKNRGGMEMGKPVELYVIPAWCMAPVSDGSLFGVKSYQLTVSGRTLEIPKEDIIHWKKPRLSLDLGTHDHLRGFSPLLPQKKILTQADAITDASVSMYQQGGAKGILFNPTLDNLDDAAKDRIQSVVDKKINNNDVKGAVATVQGEWGYLNVGLNSVDMDLLEADERVIKKICFSLGFPAELYQSDSTFANKEQAWLFFITNTLMPMTASFDAELNRALLPDFKEQGFIASDYTDLPEMAAIRQKSALALQNEWMVTPNEKRQALGYEPLDMEEMDKIYIPSGNVPIDEASVGTMDPKANTDDYND